MIPWKSPLVAAARCYLVAIEPTLAGQGWYLMGPPGERLPKDLNTNLSKWPVGSWAEVRAKLLKDIPLSEWANFQAFDTAATCQEELDRRQVRATAQSLQELQRLSQAKGPEFERQAKVHQVVMDDATYQSLCLCVASDDPRLRR
jgi:hypothetical protein